MIAYIYPLNTTLNGKVNYEKLGIELATSPLPKAVAEGIKGSIYVTFENALDDTQKATLAGIIGAHDGETPRAFDHVLVGKRTDVILQLNQMGIYHSFIDNDELVEYLTHIDNWVNAFIRSANPSAILKKIYKDASVSDIAGTPALQEDGVTPVVTTNLEYYDFLHTVSNPLTGIRVFQFFASKILEAAAL